MVASQAKQAPAKTLAAATICIVLLELVLPLTVLQTYDRFIPSVSRSSLSVFCVFAALCMVAEAGLRLARSVLLNLGGASFAHRTGCEVMERLLSTRSTGGSTSGTGANLALLGTVRGMREMTSGRWLTGLAELALIPLAMGLIAVIAGPLVLLPLALTAGFAVLSFRVGRRLEAAREVRQDRDTERFDAMVEMFRGLGTVKALSVEPTMLRRYEASKFRSTLAHLEVMKNITRLFDANASFGTFLVMSLIVAGAFLTVAGQITAGAMIAAVILSGRCMPPIQKGLSLLSRRQEYLVERRQVDARLAELTCDGVEDAGAEPENLGQLELEGVSIDSRAGTILETVDFRFAEKAITWVDTDDHATLLSLYRVLAGIEAPRAGRMLLNGVDMAQVPDRIRARQIALLQSDTVLYRGSIMDNISRFGAVSLSDVLFISRNLGLDAELSALPRGYDTMLRGDGGDPLPPGLRHRIALARALAPRPRVVLFNQADTGLDLQSYAMLSTLLGKLRGHATVVLSTADANLQGLATHRLSLGKRTFTSRTIDHAPGLSVARYRELRM